MNGFASFVRKETLHIFRDPRTMLIALLMPVVQILLFGFALSTEVNNVDVAVVAPHRSETVRQAVERMAANPNFTFTGYIPSGEIDRTLRSGRADAVAVFAGDFDRRMADRMARIANISLEELGQTIFSASISDDKPADVLLFTDFKDFHIADHDFGVSQITCVDSNRMMQRKDEFLSVMRKTMEERGYTLMILMLTDVLLEGTHLLYLGDEDIITQAFGVQLKDHTCFLPGVVSRKKQVIPSLTALWG